MFIHFSFFFLREEDMCDPVTYASGDEPKSERIYVPCGLIAQSTFNGLSSLALFFL